MGYTTALSPSKHPLLPSWSSGLITLLLLPLPSLPRQRMTQPPGEAGGAAGICLSVRPPPIATQGRNRGGERQHHAPPPGGMRRQWLPSPLLFPSGCSLRLSVVTRRHSARLPPLVATGVAGHGTSKGRWGGGVHAHPPNGVCTPLPPTHCGGGVSVPWDVAHGGVWFLGCTVAL